MLALSVAAVGMVAEPAMTAGAASPVSAAGSGAAPVPGARLWVSRYNGQVSPHDWSHVSSVAAAAGRVFVTGGTAGNDITGDFATVAYSAATGRQLWISRYNGPAGHSDTAAALAVSADGTKVFVTGASQTRKAGLGEDRTYFSDYATVAYSAATGAQLWVKRYNGPAGKEDRASSVSVARDGSTVFVTGTSQATGRAFDYTTIAYSSASGRRLWLQRYNGPASRDDTATSVASPGGGRVYVTGSSTGRNGADHDYATLAYSSATGKRLWVSRYNGPANSGDIAFSMAVSPDRAKVIVTGTRYYGGGHSGYATVAYSAVTGRQLWARRYNSPYRGHRAHAYAASVSPAETVYVTGASEGNASRHDWDYTTVAYSVATGARLWVSRYRPGASLATGAVTVTSPGNGKVYVTGISDGGIATRNDFATVAYDAATGRQLWASRYNGPRSGYDEAAALTVSPDRTEVFVTGTSGRSYATIAYQG